MRISRRAFLKRTFQASVAVGVIYPTLIEPFRVVVEKITISLNRLPPAFSGFKIVQLSDLHYQPFTTLRQIEHVVKKVNALHPDLIVLTGDFITEGNGHIEDLAPILGRLQATHGVTGILGNHDQANGADEITASLRKAGLEVLRNAGRPITLGDSTIYLAGVDSICGNHGAYPNLNAALAQRTPGLTTILLAHEPDYADLVPVASAVHLQLSGHSHGGQVCLPFIGAPMLPTWGKKYWRGLRKIHQMQLYTNRGIGTIYLPARIGSLPEITEITLRTKSVS